MALQEGEIASGICFCLLKETSINKARSLLSLFNWVCINCTFGKVPIALGQ